MSLNQLTHDVYKPWLNARVNNLTVDGTITGGGIVPIEDSVTVRGIIPDPATAPLPFTINATLPSDMIPVANSWYSLQYLVFLARDVAQPAPSKIVDFNVIVYVDNDFKIKNIGVNEWPAQYPPAPVLAIGYLANCSVETNVPYQVRAVISNLPLPNPPLQPGAPYRYAFVVSDSRRLA